MRAFAEKHFDLIIGVGFAQAPIIQKVVEDYPSIKFAIIDGVVFEDDGKTPKKMLHLCFFESMKAPT